MEIVLGILTVGGCAAVAAAVWVFVEEKAVMRRSFTTVISQTNTALAAVDARLRQLESGGKVLPFVKPQHRGPPPGGPKGLS